MFLPGHEDVGGEDWFTKKLMESNQKSNSKNITAGIETRSNLLQNTSDKQGSSLSANKQRKDGIRRPSVAQTLSIVASLNDRLARQAEK